jgi:hypothetical protein
LLRILWMDLGDGGAAGTVVVATSARKNQGKKALGGLKTLKVSNNFGPAGHQNPLRAAKFNGGVCKLEFMGGTPSPHKKAQGKEASFLYCPDREKAFAAAKGRRNVEAEAVAKDDSDNDEGASIGRPWTGRDPDDPVDQAGDGCKTRAIKSGCGTAVGTSRPKAGQDPDDPADRAGERLPQARPAKVPPKNRRGVPVNIVNKDGLSRDEVSLASKDEFASKEGDDEHDPDEDIAAAARLALGVKGLRPSDEARAAAARLLGAVIVQRALAALHNNTDDEASSAAASNSKAAAQATLRDGVEPNEEAGFEANWQAKKGGHTREEAGRATKRKPNHVPPQGGGMRGPQVLTADEEANFEARAPRKARDPHAEAWLAWLQARRDHKEAAHAAAQRKTNHAAYQGGGTCSPKVLTALFGSTVGKNQGKTRQGVNAANFLPAPRSPPTWPTKAVGRATLQSWRRLAWRLCMVHPRWQNPRGKPDRV